ncbi:MAG: hypothetical protein MJ245_06900 [Clostridia bacterium]|nr:hypothetical protein [Clostridia bacterium]
MPKSKIKVETEEKTKTPKEKKTKTKKVDISYDKLIDLKDTFKELGGDVEKLGISLIDEALFCGDTLTKLKQRVNDEGVITKMSQGNYSIDRENPALKSYNTTIKNYQSLCKQIVDLLPSVNQKTDDGFDEF